MSNEIITTGFKPFLIEISKSISQLSNSDFPKLTLLDAVKISFDIYFEGVKDVARVTCIFSLVEYVSTGREMIESGHSISR